MTKRTLNELKIQEIKKKIYEIDDDEEHYKSDKSIKNWIEDWDYSKYRTDLYTHKIHNYPAMFIPQVARKIILEFSKEGDTVLDIFCGSGTTLVESKVLNRNSIGIDLNPYAILLSKVKTTNVNTNSLIDTYIEFYKYMYNTSINFQKVDFKNINEWFSAEVIDIFSKIKSFITQIDDEKISNVFKVIFGNIIRLYSFCKHNGFKLHRDKKKMVMNYCFDEIMDSFFSSFIKVSKSINKINQFHSDVEIIYGDSRFEKLNKEVDLIVTSPPYGDSRTTVAYGQFSRLQSQWMDIIIENDNGSIKNIDSELLGGKIRDIDLDDDVIYKSNTLKQTIFALQFSLDMKERKNINRVKDVISFYKDLDLTLKNASLSIKENGYFILIVASRIVKEIKTNIDLIISELSYIYGFNTEAIFYRKIPNKRMPLTVSSTNIKGQKTKTMDRESIIVLKKNK